MIMMQASDIKRLWLLRDADQTIVAFAIFLAMFATTAWFIIRGGCGGQLVEVELAPRHEYSFRVDINRATWPELAQLPGIGETTARKIIASREKDGPFAGHDGLRRVRGIGPKKAARIRPFLLPVENGE